MRSNEWDRKWEPIRQVIIRYFLSGLFLGLGTGIGIGLGLSVYSHWGLIGLPIMVVGYILGVKAQTAWGKLWQEEYGDKYK